MKEEDFKDRIENLIRVTLHAHVLMNRSIEETVKWVMEPSSTLMDYSPLDICLTGQEVKPLMDWLIKQNGEADEG